MVVSISGGLVEKNNPVAAETIQQSTNSRGCVVVVVMIMIVLWVLGVLGVLLVLG